MQFEIYISILDGTLMVLIVRSENGAWNMPFNEIPKLLTKDKPSYYR